MVDHDSVFQLLLEQPSTKTDPQFTGLRILEGPGFHNVIGEDILVHRWTVLKTTPLVLVKIVHKSIEEVIFPIRGEIKEAKTE